MSISESDGIKRILVCTGIALFMIIGYAAWSAGSPSPSDPPIHQQPVRDPPPQPVPPISPVQPVIPANVQPDKKEVGEKPGEQPMTGPYKKLLAKPTLKSRFAELSKSFKRFSAKPSVRFAFWATVVVVLSSIVAAYCIAHPDVLDVLQAKMANGYLWTVQQARDFWSADPENPQPVNEKIVNGVKRSRIGAFLSLPVVWIPILAYLCLACPLGAARLVLIPAPEKTKYFRLLRALMDVVCGFLILPLALLLLVVRSFVLVTSLILPDALVDYLRWMGRKLLNGMSAISAGCDYAAFGKARDLSAQHKQLQQWLDLDNRSNYY